MNLRIGHYTATGALIREVEVLPDWTLAEPIHVGADGEILLIAIPQEEAATLTDIATLAQRTHASRWTAFTDDELHEMRRALDSEWPMPDDIEVRSVISTGVSAEIERRRRRISA